MWDTHSNRDAQTEKLRIQKTTYTSERGQRWEVVQRLQAADIHADHLELGELLQVLLIVRTESLHWCLVKNQVVELIDR